MRTTLNIDDQLLAEAQRITGIAEKEKTGARGFTGTHPTGKCSALGEAWRKRATTEAHPTATAYMIL